VVRGRGRRGPDAAPIGALLAIPAIRFPGLYLALATLGFGILLQQMFYPQSYMSARSASDIHPTAALSWLNLASDNGYYTGPRNHHRGHGTGRDDQSQQAGRLLRAMADSPAGVGACGASINVSRVLVFCLSASLRGRGILDAGTLGIVVATLSALVSLQLFALILLTVGRSPWYAVAAAAVQILIPAYVSTSVTVGYALTTIFGLAAIALSVTPTSSRELPTGDSPGHRSARATPWPVAPSRSDRRSNAGRDYRRSRDFGPIMPHGGAG